ncbi:MAG: NAD(P)H-hydrate epimerase, partial [Alphaproteobacteria bacterium]|nr:NAD(P)H-hydrate epimerase [Alphaproteobacteria bacterium]
MYRADAAAEAAGVSGIELMEAAGTAVADALSDICPGGRVAVLCGPGNNGGDGFVAARLLVARGYKVSLALLGKVESLKGDAAANAERWTGGVSPLAADVLDDADVVIDAVFGAGLSRPVEGTIREVLEAVCERGLPCVAVDVPSGLHGDDGRVRGFAPHADVTVTFFRRKPGHLLYPGRALCGSVRLADIGTPQSVLGEIAPKTFENGPRLWQARFPQPDPEGHKYTRGHAVISGGRELTGAARLAGHGALRAGAGLVTIAAHPDALPVYRAGRPSIMVRETPDVTAFADMLNDPRLRAVLVGPGNGVDVETAGRMAKALSSEVACVIDADAITVGAEDPAKLCGAIRKRTAAVVLTPHEGEFARLFGREIDLEVDARLAAARSAARLSGATVILKGPDTIIASPDGRAAINTNAPP